MPPPAAALKSWDDEFGYELIGDDKQLDYGQADPVTAAAIENTVQTARQRQALLAAAMPRKFGNGDPLASFAGGGGRWRWSGFGGGAGGSRHQPAAWRRQSVAVACQAAMPAAGRRRLAAASR